jgi:YggT family protein
MPETFQTALIFLIDTLFNLYLFILTVRVLLIFVGSHYLNPFTVFIAKITDRGVRPIKHRVHNFRRLETASIILIFGLEIMKFFLVTCIGFGFPHIVGLPILAVADMLALIIQVLTYAIIFQVILSLIQPLSPYLPVVSQLATPILRPFQRIIPLVGNVDLSPIPALICLQLISMLVIGPLSTLGQNITFS